MHYDKRNMVASPISKFVIDAFLDAKHAGLMLSKAEFLQAVEAAAPSRAAIARVLNISPPRVTEMYKDGRDLSYEEARLLAEAFELDNGPVVIQPNEETVAAILRALLPSAPVGDVSESAARALAVALLHGLELLGSSGAIDPTQRELAMASRAAVARFRAAWNA